MHEISYLAETAAHDHEIEEINAEAFGPGRFARAAYKIRAGAPRTSACCPSSPPMTAAWSQPSG